VRGDVVVKETHRAANQGEENRPFDELENRDGEHDRIAARMRSSVRSHCFV
jgi:hypothetical protein